MIPAGIAKQYGSIAAAVIQGSARLLLARLALEKLLVHLDFEAKKMNLLQTTADMTTNEAGQLLGDIWLNQPKTVENGKEIHQHASSQAQGKSKVKI